MIRVNGLAPLHAGNDLGPWHRNLAALVVHEIGGRALHTHFDTAQSADVKVGVEVLAAKLIVSDGAKAGFFLLRDSVADECVFNLAQGGVADFAGGTLPACLLELWRAQQAADVVSAKGRVVRGA